MQNDELERVFHADAGDCGSEDVKKDEAAPDLSELPAAVDAPPAEDAVGADNDDENASGARSPEENLDGASAETAQSRRARVSPRRFIKPIASVASAVVFALAMYVEISAAVVSFVPDGFVFAISQLSFGGSFADSADSADSNAVDPSESTDSPSEQPSVTAPVEPSDSAPLTDAPNDPGESGGERYPIVTRDLSTNVERGLTCSNQTDYELDLDYFADAEFTLPPLDELIASFPPDTENPVVLIVHTHGTEAYAEEGADSYSVKDNARSTDITKNVVAVGEVMAQYFEEHGIKTIHCTEMFDRDSYVDAYENSSAAVREYLAIYPSIRYIFDVHRDSVIGDDYTKYRPLTDVDGVPTAQFMCVVGTNFKGASHPHWRDNLTLAAHLQTRLWDRSNTLPRRLSIRGASFYQQYAPGSLLLEIGSCGNTLSQAKSCALIVAEELTNIIISGE